MSVLEIVIYPDKRLTMPSQEVVEFDSKLKKELDELKNKSDNDSIKREIEIYERLDELQNIPKQKSDLENNSKNIENDISEIIIIFSNLPMKYSFYFLQQTVSYKSCHIFIDLIKPLKIFEEFFTCHKGTVLQFKAYN